MSGKLCIVAVSLLAIACSVPAWSQPPVPPVTGEHPQLDNERKSSAIDPHADDSVPELGVMVGSCPGEAVCILDTRAGSPAAMAGLREGDYILMIDGEKTTSPAVLKQAIEKHDTDDSVTVIFWRRGQDMTKEVMLESDPRTLPIDQKAWLGAMLRTDAAGAIIVNQIIPGGPAESAGLQPGDMIVRLNDQLVAELESFVDQIAKLDVGTKVHLMIRRGGVEQIVNATLGQADNGPSGFLRPAFRPPLFGIPIGPPRFAPDPTLDGTLHEMRRQIHELQEQVRELSGQIQDRSDIESDNEI